MQKYSAVHVHFIGICGSGMSVLAKYLIDLGFNVSGSDLAYSDTYARLEKLGAILYLKHNAKNVESADIVVVSSAISIDNVEYNRALFLKKPIFNRAELLAKIIKTFKHSISVAGSHGKTTTTAMASHVLKVLNKKFTAFIGGEDSVLTNYQFSKNKNYVVSEICEYKNNFKWVNSEVAVVLNIDNDHLDYYKNLNNLKNAFFSFLNKAKYKVVNYDDVNLLDYKEKGVVSFAVKNKADFNAYNLKNVKGKFSFDCMLKNGDVINIKLNVLGYHNVYNALAIIAVFNGVYGFNKEIIKKGIENFASIKKRFEFLGNVNGKNFYYDYCHHPKEIEATIKTYDEFIKDDYVLIFQPHTFSRTKLLFNDFIKVLKNKRIYIYKTYPAREFYDYNGSGLKLSRAIGCGYIKNRKTLETIVNTEKYTNNFIFIGAGDLYDIINQKIKNGLK
ncbi:MAG: UDP-N-acetylmuramate--L-alanine ligase [Clostridia bacterium]|nr:UDP-N-acetylmuramate--L-alanine ligase [Clostridia bacterium]